MITLDYHVSPLSPERRSDRGALDSATEGDLRYSLFLGDVIFKIGETDFSARWDWVPVLDFALGLEHLIKQLEGGEESVEFEFTESDSAIRFTRENGEVFVSASYAPYRAVAKISELAQAVRAFRQRVVADLFLTYPQLRTNEAIRGLINDNR